MQFLVARDAVVDARIVDGATPLMMASYRGHAPVVRALLAAGADVNVRKIDGFTALHMAGQDGHIEILRELLKREPHVDAQDNDGDTPLMVACLWGHSMAAVLLFASGADIHLRSNAGLSARDAAEDRVRRDALPPAAGIAAPTAAQKAEHKKLVRVMKAFES